ncbi:MAG: sigma-54-dependent Fis family transcriptional regulator [Gammaproteobacteria bacterium]|nr:sigma-54-dependent Fis family transcriptional regulator [Gammaproteobacteria bacterium]
MTEYSICIVDDDKSLAGGIACALKKNYRTTAFFTGASALEAINDKPPDIVLLDMGLPDMSGIEVLKKIKAGFPETEVIMITGFDDVKTAVSAVKAGARDYIVKPLQPDSLKITIENVIESIRLKKEIRIIQEKCLKENFPFFIGKSRDIRKTMNFVKHVAASPDTPVLILGESGTGKEHIAAAIHYTSPNFRGVLVTINCAAIPDTLIESELFGYEKGAFSGAGSKGKKGLLEKADKGTLFLDEIGDLSCEAQAKLLRFLETGKFYRVGGMKSVRIQARIVSATNKNMETMIKKGLFREDLYYRIGVIQVEVPSLNSRRDDILLIAGHFLAEFAEKFGKKITGLSPGAEALLKQYRWKGNVRELKNVMERAVLIATGDEVGPDDLGIKPVEPVKQEKARVDTEPLISPDGADLQSVLESVEKQYIETALKMARGNEARAAALLNIKYSTFRYRRRKLAHSGPMPDAKVSDDSP